MKKSNSQKPTSTTNPHPGPAASDASDTQQRAIQTHNQTTQQTPGLSCKRSLCSTSEHPQRIQHIRLMSRGVLLRKEVIQPHLPVRLPCYDFVPIASPTFDGSPHKG